MNLDEQEAKLIEAEREAEKRIRIIKLLRIQTALLRGMINDAELIAASMSNRTEADRLIAEFKRKYAGSPLGQWNGVG